jgi:hypothetical protein
MTSRDVSEFVSVMSAIDEGRIERFRSRQDILTAYLEQRTTANQYPCGLVDKLRLPNFQLSTSRNVT